MPRRLAHDVVFALAISLAAACKKDDPQASHAASETPVGAPAALMAEGALRDPDAFWARIHKGSGASLARMPESAAGAILGWVGADPTLAPLVAGGLPFYVALGDAPDAVSFAIAMKVGNVEVARSSLIEGETARYRGEESDGIIHLLPREGASPGQALGLSWSGYLVVASSAADLATLGPYASRTLPTKASPTSSFELRLTPAALVWMGKKAPDWAGKSTIALAAVARGLLPPEVDASALAACFTPGLQDMFDMAGDLAEARVEANTDDSQLDAVATLTPRSGDNGATRRLAAMHPASAAPLLGTPNESIAAFFWSDTAQVRAEDASTLGPCMGKALTPILGSGGETRLAGLLASWAKGRGDWETAAFVAIPSVAGLIIRAPVADGPALTASVRGLADLASQPAVADAVRRVLPLRAGVAQPVEVPRVGKGSMIAFPTHPPLSRGIAESPPGAELLPPGMAWAVDGKEVDLGLGQSPKDLLAMSRPAAELRTSASITRSVGALGAESSFVAVVTAPGCCKDAGPTSAPVTFGWGRRGSDGRATLAIGDELLGQLLARAAAR